MEKLNTTYAFEKLNVYTLSREVIKTIYILSGSFPKQETYGLTDQIRRASVSISSNIAEGSGRDTAKMKQLFYGYAYSSVLEVYCQLDISHDLGYITDQVQYQALRNKLKVLSYRIHKLKSSLYPQ